MFIIFHMLVLSLILFGVQKYCREYNKAAIGIFIIMPLVLTPYWLSIVHQDWFAWLKLYSVIVGSVWLILLCNTRLKEKIWAKQIFLGILFVNIVEAIVKDFTHAALVHYINAISGILILLPLLLKNTIAIKRTDETSENKYNYELLWIEANRLWIFCYSLWNITFIYLNLPFLLSSHIVVLSVALWIGMYQPQRWLQARAYTLCITLLLQFTFGFYFKGPLINSSSWYTEQGALLGSVATLSVISILYLWRYFDRCFALLKNFK